MLLRICQSPQKARLLRSPTSNMVQPHHRNIRTTVFWGIFQGVQSEIGLQSVESYLRDMGLASVWVMARRRPIWRIWAWRLPGRWPDGGLSEGYGHGGPDICLGDGQTIQWEPNLNIGKTQKFRRKIECWVELLMNRWAMYNRLSVHSLKFLLK